jgi:hypothetical protein
MGDVSNVNADLKKTITKRFHVECIIQVFCGEGINREDSLFPEIATDSKFTIQG